MSLPLFEVYVLQDFTSSLPLDHLSDMFMPTVQKSGCSIAMAIAVYTGALKFQFQGERASTGLGFSGRRTFGL